MRGACRIAAVWRLAESGTCRLTTARSRLALAAVIPVHAGGDQRRSRFSGDLCAPAVRQSATAPVDRERPDLAANRRRAKTKTARMAGRFSVPAGGTQSVVLSRSRNWLGREPK